MKRVAIFAHYDHSNIIDDYVIFYLKKLKETVDNIIFISDCEIGTFEINKIKDIVTDFSCFRYNFSKDFGSYKRGFEILISKYKEIYETCEELLFINDSCYCIGDFKDIFNKSSKIDCDAWSLCDDYSNGSFKYNNYHLQSYFIAFRTSIFKEKFFIDFIKNIKNYRTAGEIVKNYEEGLSTLLINNLKVIKSLFSRELINDYITKNYLYLVPEIINFISSNSDYKEEALSIKITGDSFDISKMNHIHTNKIFFLIKNGFPLVKRASIDGKLFQFNDQKITFFWKEILETYTEFDVTLIENHLKRIQAKYKKKSDIFCNNSLKKLKLKFLFNRKLTKSNRILIKILKIPVYSSKLESF